MFPRPFEYERAASVENALDALSDPDTKAIAGGQSLIPMMNLGLVTPARVIDIGGLELHGVERRNGTITIGALTRHRALELGHEPDQHLPLAAEAARQIGNPRVRNRGTIGGSLVHADPAAELGAVVLAYGGHAVIRGRGGVRRVNFDEFFQGLFDTAVEPDELLVAAEIDMPPERTGTAFVELALRAGDFAVAAAAAVVSVEAAGVIVSARIALAGVGDRPLRCAGAEEICTGEVMSDSLGEEIRRLVGESIEPEDDAFASGAYRTRVARACAVRAMRTAWDRAVGGEGTA